MTDHKELLKKLVDAPFGEAEKILRAEGLWDEKRAIDKDAKIQRYRVRVSASMPVTATIYVNARSTEEAEELAEAEADDFSFEWDYNAGAEDIMIMDVGVEP